MAPQVILNSLYRYGDLNLCNIRIDMIYECAEQQVQVQTESVENMEM